MPSCCVVPGCTNKGGFLFPKECSLSLKWRIALRRIVPYINGKDKLWKPSSSSVICKIHFKPEDFQAPKQTYGIKPKLQLKSGAVPSFFPWTKVTEENLAPHERANKRESLINTVTEPSDECSEESQSKKQILDNQIDNFHMDCDVTVKIEDVFSKKEEQNNKLDEECQTDFPPSTSTKVNDEPISSQPMYSIEKFINDSSAILYYTGLLDIHHFNHLFSCLGPAVDHLNYQNQTLTRKDELFLTLMKLRQNKDEFELSIMFKIPQTLVGKIFKTWLNFLYCQFKEIDIFLPKDITELYMPGDFKLRFDEQIIGSGKTYKILQGEIEKTPMGIMILYVCFILCNFHNNVVNKHS